MPGELPPAEASLLLYQTPIKFYANYSRLMPDVTGLGLTGIAA
jgi:hypothetical protein